MCRCLYQLYIYECLFVIHMRRYLYECVLYVKLATVVEGDPKTPFSIATTLRCRRGRYSFPWIVPLYPRYVPYNAVLSKEVSSTIFKSLVWLDLGLNPGLPDHWRTLYSPDQYVSAIYIYIYIHTRGLLKSSQSSQILDLSHTYI